MNYNAYDVPRSENRRTETTKKRNAAQDIVKGLAILTVVQLHSLQLTKGIDMDLVKKMCER